MATKSVAKNIQQTLSIDPSPFNAFRIIGHGNTRKEINAQEYMPQLCSREEKWIYGKNMKKKKKMKRGREGIK